ncbi:hypothetical protein ACHAWF_013600, partial [Thalassiosira exigua]
MWAIATVVFTRIGMSSSVAAHTRRQGTISCPADGGRCCFPLVAIISQTTLQALPAAF